MNAMLAALTVAGRTVDVLVQRHVGALRLVHVEAGGAAGRLFIMLHRHRQVVLQVGGSRSSEIRTQHTSIRHACGLQWKQN